MIWQNCHGVSQISPLTGNLYRLVESQEQKATTHYVDDLSEQALLEQMLDDSKPPYPIDSSGYHYLLTTPFRYPPLEYGSRFGRVFEPSLFYGATDDTTTLAESAYYRFIYWFSMEGTPPKLYLSGQHTLFAANYKTAKGIQLQNPPFNEYREALTNQHSYTQCQQLGTDMRNAGVVVFEYESARFNKGVNVALYQIEGFNCQTPSDMHQVVSRTTANKVEFRDITKNKTLTFDLDSFLLNGILPSPAE